MPAKKTIFISSTCHDLGDLRNTLDIELTRHGFIPVLSDNGTVPVKSDKHSYENCLEAARECDITLGVIGGRFGGEYPGTNKSITQVEIEEAIKAKRQVFVVVRADVMAAKEALRPYRKANVKFCESKIVQDERVFDVIDAITNLRVGNWIHSFTVPHDIVKYLAEQLQFGWKSMEPEGAERLNRTVARKFLTAIPQRLVEGVSEGVQSSCFKALYMESLEEGWDSLVPAHIRFRDTECDRLLGQFMTTVSTVLWLSPGIFKYGVDPNLLIERHAGEQSRAHHVLEVREELHMRAKEMVSFWHQLLDEIKQKWPETLADIIENTS